MLERDLRRALTLGVVIELTLWIVDYTDVLRRIVDEGVPPATLLPPQPWWVQNWYLTTGRAWDGTVAWALDRLQLPLAWIGVPVASQLIAFFGHGDARRLLWLGYVGFACGFAFLAAAWALVVLAILRTHANLRLRRHLPA